MTLQLGGANGADLKLVRKITDEEYSLYKIHASRLFEFSSGQQLYFLVRGNYEAYFGILDEYYKAYVEDALTMDGPTLDNILLTSNRHLLNLLSSFRTYIDHSTTTLSRKHGKNSERLQRFKLACQRCYENEFSYRFLYKMRNYAQHCGMPIGPLEIESESTQDGIKHTFSAFVSKARLLADYNEWGSLLSKEISALPDNININEHVINLMRSLNYIRLVILDDDLTDLLKSAHFIKELVTPVIEREAGQPFIVPLEDEQLAKGNFIFDAEWIPFYLAEKVLAIETERS
jgi:hypothetical protein